ncbi:MAG: 23S rRNA (pseudouridine(1915)-N(3))-methyltransferase RlmH [Clostridiales bacterium]
MKVIFLNTGKTDSLELNKLIGIYEKRLSRFVPFEIVCTQTPKNAGKLKSSELKKEEGELLLQKMKEADYIVLLDEKGKHFTSNEFAQFLQGQMNKGIRKIMFVSGGAYGFAEEIYQKAHLKLSISKMTTTHQLIRLFFSEQLYRAFTILNNHPYHNN